MISLPDTNYLYDYIQQITKITFKVLYYVEKNNLTPEILFSAERRLNGLGMVIEMWGGGN